MPRDLPDGYVYVLPPIDYWTGWRSSADALPEHEFEEEVRGQQAAEVERRCEHALEQFRARTGWEGDIREGPFVSGLPPLHGGSESDLMVAVKQDNNGLTFIWSPHELSWLAEFVPEYRSPPRR